MGLAQHKLAWICSRSQERAAALIRQIEEGQPGSPPDALADWRQALDRRDTDGVVIATPNALHYPMAKLAVEREKHVLVEYPHGVTPREGRDLLRLAGRRGRVIHVGLSHRYSPLISGLKRLIGEGTGSLGAPRSYHLITCSGNPISRWYDRDELSGGMFVASLFHFIDETLSLFSGPTVGEPTLGVPTLGDPTLGSPTVLSARYSSTRFDGGVIDRDCADLTLSFPAGCVSHLTYARGYPKPGLGTVRTLICEAGYLTIFGGKIRLVMGGVESTLPEEGADPLRSDTLAFIDAVEKSGSDPTGPQSQRSLVVAARAQAMAF
jgi:predicted dehydrogenase